MSATTVLDARLTVNELLKRHPSVLPVLNAFGVDTCCGGSESLAEAATSSRIPLETLLAGLDAAIQRGTR